MLQNSFVFHLLKTSQFRITYKLFNLLLTSQILMCSFIHSPAIYLTTLCLNQRFSEDFLIINSKACENTQSFNFKYSPSVYKKRLRKIKIKLS